jgi:hypothetical protein
MYLMDTIGHAAQLMRPISDPVVGVFADLAKRLEGAPRFLFDDAATRTAVELNLGRPKVLREAMAHIRIPYPKLWVEWDDAARQKLREKFDEPLSYAELRPMPGRVGFLLEADPSGRRGHATWLWTTPQSGTTDIASVGAIEPFFDLDRRFALPPARVEGLLKGNLAREWLDNPVQLEALFDIWRTAEHRPSQWGKHYLALFDQLQEALSYADVVGEYMMIWAALLLLTASRPVVDLVSIDLGRLNRRRVKQGKRPLLDYTQVSLHLDSPETQYNPVLRGPLYGRKSPRVHLVSSYLARRGDKHWVVQPYWRGQGETISRHVAVKG